ncbi:unnamed protein product [Parascedosporium putredinis]|uniref:MaoC-like domain-containing protein n=1 Tax=Parascedosporium putredinis TaxID=1442378 RepID=A0A9P1HBH9_9PEZI|nr:unnamed protein product [Parascedosporium putredinis]CAI8003262.1 unnamed protein product [Parascedosporium putredinis]
MAGSIQQFITTAKARPPKLIRDYLSPTNSHLLSLLLADVLPPSCYPYPLSSASPNPTNSTGPSPHLAGSSSLPPLPQSPPWGKPLPLGHHLVYFPLQARPTELAWDGADNDHAPGSPKEKPDYSVSLTPSSSLLFGFSALTYNAHRIHIDPEYARSEGHRAMLFHGPFSVVVLLTVLNSQLAPGESVDAYDYRNFRPLYVDEKLTVCVRRIEGGPGRGCGWGISVRGTVTTSFREAVEAKL